MTDDTVRLQMLDYLRILRAYPGVGAVFGILTSYKEWRFVWLSDCDDAAKADTVQDVVPKVDPEPAVSTVPAATTKQSVAPASSHVQLRSDCDGVVVTDTGSPAVTSAVVGTCTGGADSKMPQELSLPGIHSSRIYEWNDPDFVIMLALTLLRMANANLLSSGLDPAVAHEGVSVVRFCPTDYTTTKLSKITTTDDFPTKGSDTFSVLKQLGQGRDGVVYYVCTPEGSTAAVKLSMYDDEGSALRAELNVWQKLWGSPVCAESPGKSRKKSRKTGGGDNDAERGDKNRCYYCSENGDECGKSCGACPRMITVANRLGLLMPYLDVPYPNVPDVTKLSTDDARKDLRDLLNAVTDAVRYVAGKGYKIGDLQWRHVGLRRSSEKRNDVVLFDLYDAEPVGTNEKPEEAMKKLKEAEENMMIKLELPKLMTELDELDKPGKPALATDPE